MQREIITYLLSLVIDLFTFQSSQLTADGEYIEKNLAEICKKAHKICIFTYMSSFLRVYPY